MNDASRDSFVHAGAPTYALCVMRGRICEGIDGTLWLLDHGGLNIDCRNLKSFVPIHHSL